MKVLVVGCGAVGQVYGLALQKAGAELGLYDRPAALEKIRLAQSRGGLPLFQLDRTHQKNPVEQRLKDLRVLTDTAGCRDFQPEQIWFATPSQAYYTEWFRDFLREVPSRRVVCFIPEGPRPEFIPPGEEERMVFGGTTFMAWQGDLGGGGGRAEGVNFYRSPLSLPLVGEKAVCGEVAQLLERGGFRVSIGKPGSHQQAAVTAVMTTFVAGLELSGWSLREYRRNAWRGRAAGACREAVLSQLPGAGALTRALLGRRLLSAAFWLAAALLPGLVPFNLEKYLGFHYRKTREQTLVLLDLFARDGEKRGLPVEGIRRVREAMTTPNGGKC